MTDPVAVGFRCHSGWAVLVVVSGSERAPVLLDRRRVELVDEAVSRHPYHAVANGTSPSSLIDEVTEAATTAARDALRSVAAAEVLGVVASERRIPDELDRVLASHALLHAAEGRLFERAVIDAGGDVGLRVHVVDPKSILVPAVLDSLRASVGPPWQKDHKWAATAALGALAAR